MSKIQVLVQQLTCKTVIASAVCLSLMACTQVKPAPIRDVSVGENQETSTEGTPPLENKYTPPPTIASSAKTSEVANTKETSIQPVAKNTVYQRNYGQIPKGEYKGNQYTVKQGDTLFYIAWITGNDYHLLAQKNNLQAPYSLSVGQVLDVSGGAKQSTVASTSTKVTTKPQVDKEEPVAITSAKPKIFKETTITKTTTTVLPEHKSTTVSAAKAGSTVIAPSKKKENDEVQSQTQPVVATATSHSQKPAAATATVANIRWQWPTKGKVMVPFSSAKNGNKGIDISGEKGQDIVAAASGIVVYTGNAVPGYGNLVIIKHSNGYLTAYAHNDRILVQEEQNISAGQRIATMGRTGTSSVRLHFEVRYEGKPVDPMKYLP